MNFYENSKLSGGFGSKSYNYIDSEYQGISLRTNIYRRVYINERRDMSKYIVGTKKCYSSLYCKKESKKVSITGSKKVNKKPEHIYTKQK